MQNIRIRQRASHLGIVCILCFLLYIICSLCMIQAQPAFAEGTTADAPATPTIVSFESNADRQATATWKTVEEADGYDLRYANSEGAATVTVTPGTVKAKTLKLLKGEYDEKVVKLLSVTGGDVSSAGNLVDGIGGKLGDLLGGLLGGK